MIRLIIYLILMAFILYRVYREEKLYKLIFVPIIILSYLGTTNYFQEISRTGRILFFLAAIALSVLLIHLYVVDIKKTRVKTLRERQREREREKTIKQKDPHRKQKIVIQDMKNNTETVYWVAPTIKERYSPTDKDDKEAEDNNKIKDEKKKEE